MLEKPVTKKSPWMAKTRWKWKMDNFIFQATGKCEMNMEF